MHFASLADFRPALDRHMGEQTGSFSDRNMLPDDTKGPDLDVVGAGLGMNDRCWMYLHACPLKNSILNGHGRKRRDRCTVTVTYDS